MAINNNPHTRFYALLAKMPYADKEQLVFEASGGRTISLSTFVKTDFIGYNRMLLDMQRMVNDLENSAKDNEVIEAEKRRYRSIILAKLNERGVIVKNWDYSEVNTIIQSCTKSNKTMKTMSLEELKKLSRQMHKIMDWYDKKKLENHTLVKLN